MTAAHLVLLQGARVDHRIVSRAVVIATGISATGHREISALMVGDSESKPFRTKFPRSFARVFPHRAALARLAAAVLAETPRRVA